MIVYASDLDQTLIFSENFLQKKNITYDKKNHIVIEYINNSPASFITKKSVEMLKRISDSSIFVPSTTRTFKQFDRINFKQFDINFKYAIVSNGANIIIDGNIDYDWNIEIKKNIENECPPFSIINKIVLKSNTKYNFLLESKIAEDVFMYYIIDNKALPDSELVSLKEYFKQFNFNLSLQGRKLYLMPIFVDKSKALKKVLEQVGSYSKLVTAGDSMLDHDMLVCSDIGFVSSGGEITKSMVNDGLFLPENIVFSSDKCAISSDEILSKVLGFLD